MIFHRRGAVIYVLQLYDDDVRADETASEMPVDTTDRSFG